MEDDTEKPLKERIKFQLSFMTVMHNVGRTEMANDALAKALSLIDSATIEKTK